MIFPFLYLNSNNSIEKKKRSLNDCSSSHLKSATALELNVKAFIDAHGLDRCGFLTLTFPDDVQDPREAQRRFNSFRTNFLKQHFKEYVCVYERQKNGRIHYHLIVVCEFNIRAGLNFAAIQRRDYRSASFELRQMWAKLREAAPRYNFGRCELLPIKSNSKGLSKYVAKYIGKTVNNRLPEDKGFRLVRFSVDKNSTWKVANSSFSFLSKGVKQWRKNLKKWVLFVIEPTFKAKYPKLRFLKLNEWNYSEMLTRYLSPKWAFLNSEQIMMMDGFLE